jgi:hypothetical protein
MKCFDCKGTGEYHGFAKIDTCKACNGTGEISAPSHMPTDDELAEAKPLQHAKPRPMVPAVGEDIYYHVEDIVGKISEVDEEEKVFHARFSYGYGSGTFGDLVWNVTKDRWEISRTQS